MRVHEGEGRIGSERNPISGRRQGRRAFCLREIEPCKGSEQSVEVNVALDCFGQTVEPAGDVDMLFGLNQPEMTRRQDETLISGQRTEHWDADRGNCVRDKGAVPLAGDAIKHDPRDPHSWIV